MAFPDRKNQSVEFPPGIITWDAIKSRIARNRFLPEAELREQLILGSGVGSALEEMRIQVQQLQRGTDFSEVYRLISIDPNNESQLQQGRTWTDYCFPGNSTYYVQQTRILNQVGSLSVSNVSQELKAVQVLQFLHFNEGVRIVQTKEKLFVLLRTVNTGYMTKLVDAQMAIQNAWHPLYFPDYQQELLDRGYIGFSVIMATDVDARFLKSLKIAAYSGRPNDAVLNRIA